MAAKWCSGGCRVCRTLFCVQLIDTGSPDQRPATTRAPQLFLGRLAEVKQAPSDDLPTRRTSKSKAPQADKRRVAVSKLLFRGCGVLRQMPFIVCPPRRTSAAFPGVHPQVREQGLHMVELFLACLQ